MKVIITNEEMSAILSAIAVSEAKWRSDADKQLAGYSKDACIQVATELHDIYCNLESQAVGPEPTVRTQHIDPFDTPWNPDDPRNW